MAFLNSQNIKEIGLFDRQALSHYLNNIPADTELMLLIFELEDLDEWVSVYAPNVVCKRGEEIPGIVNEILPSNAKFFHISDYTYCIIFEDSHIKQCLEFAYILKTFIAECKICSNISDIMVCIGIANGKVDTIMSKAFSALKYAKKVLSKIYFLDIADDVFKEYQQKEIKYNLLVKNAIRDGRIVPFYQPIYDNKTNKITKFECLSRLIDSDKVLFPFDFFDVVRKMGFMRSITLSVINNSFDIFKDNDYEFSINITEEDIRDAQVIDYLRNSCEKYHINPSRIIIELLEDVEFGDDNLVINNIFALKNMGFQIAIDDFGYANSNFGRLIKMRIDYIKIDGRFVKNIDINEVSYKIVKSIATFAKSMNVQCIAEHVHSESIQNLITSLGVEFSQGYYIGQATSKLPNMANQ